MRLRFIYYWRKIGVIEFPPAQGRWRLFWWLRQPANNRENRKDRRLRRNQFGKRGVAGPYLLRFAQEAAWREDHKREVNNPQVDRILALAMASEPSADLCGSGCGITPRSINHIG
jgi:hypothetical protein